MSAPKPPNLVPDPTPEQLSVLSGFERFSFRLADLFSRRLNFLARAWNQTFMAALTGIAMFRRLNMVGLENLAGLGPEDRLVLVANHRSFFDFYQVMAILFARTPLGRRIFFPVRASFFYDHPLGPLVNLLMSGMSMFPPIQRERRKLRFNEYALRRCIAELLLPGTVIGIHPEGTRNKGPDPYTMLKVNRGVGRVALGAGAVPVVPIFLLGAGNNLAVEIWRNLFEPERWPLDVYFGPPIRLDDLQDRAADPVAWKEAARRCVAGIEAQAARQREDRAGTPQGAGTASAGAPRGSRPAGAEEPQP